MEKKIVLLVDYKGHFGSKQKASAYRAGMDKDLLSKYFKELGYETTYLPFSEVDYSNNWKDIIVLYTSQEDVGYLYKSYIEDVVYGLELAGAIVIPSYKFLKANNNKVFMEILRTQNIKEDYTSITSKHFGAYEDYSKIEIEEYPVVLKKAEGAMSSGVYLGRNKDDLDRLVKKVSSSQVIKDQLKEIARTYKHKGYKVESKYRRKFIIQNLIPNLKKDCKILVYGNKYYFLYRDVRKNDFRASGSGNFYFDHNYQEGMLDFAKSIYDRLQIPQLSIDVCFDGKNFHLIEFQAVYFGTTTLEKSEFFYEYKNNVFNLVEEKSILEKVYAESISSYLSSLTR